MDKYNLGNGVYANSIQRLAIDKMSDFLQGNDKEFFVLEGRGGTGKTTVIKKVVEPYYGKKSIYACAPSHAAKKVLQDSFEYSPSVKYMTIASLLGMKLNQNTGKFVVDEYMRRMEGIPIEDADILIVDECSMIDEGLFSYIKKYKEKNCKVIFLGDSAQLPPIREDGGMFQDKNSPVFDITNSIRLTERMRQGEDSPIVPVTDIFAFNIDSKTLKDNPLEPYHRITNYSSTRDEGVVFTDDRKRFLSNLARDFKSEEAKKNPYHTKCIVYTNDARKNINILIRKALYGEDAKKEYVVGEQVIAFDSFVNEKGHPIIHNSDLFKVTSVTETTIKGYKAFYMEITNEFITKEVPVISGYSKLKWNNDIRELFKKKKFKKAYELKDTFADIQHAYAISSHKSQGSTYTNAYVWEDNIMETFGPTAKTKNQSMYVACSRPKKKLVILSSKNTAKT
jgi:exodeoxyribonuclease-5